MKSFYFAKRKDREGALPSVKTTTRLALPLVPAAAIVLIALALSSPISAQTITTFDAPGAGTGPFQGTYATSVDPSGTVIGFSRENEQMVHPAVNAGGNHLVRAGIGDPNVCANHYHL